MIKQKSWAEIKNAQKNRKMWGVKQNKMCTVIIEL